MVLLICVSFHLPECKSQFAAAGLNGSDAADRPAEEQHEEEEQSAPSGEPSPSRDEDPSMSEAADTTANTAPNGRWDADAASLRRHQDAAA